MPDLPNDQTIELTDEEAAALARAYADEITTGAAWRAAEVLRLDAERAKGSPGEVQPAPETGSPLEPAPPSPEAEAAAAAWTPAKEAHEAFAGGIAAAIAASPWAGYRTGGWRHNVVDGTITLLAPPREHP